MKTRHLTSACLLLGLPVTVFADTFQLKDGTSLEGRVIREDPTSYVLEVQVTKSIKDERTIAKADVRSIEREQPDLKAFEAIQPLLPTPDLLTADEYSQRIRAVEKFLADHRGSSRSKVAKEMLAKLKSEANEILAGGLKMNGRMVTPADYRANAYEIDARVQEAKIRSMIKDGHYLQALRAFNDMSRDFRNTTAHQDILPLITQTINGYLAEVSQTLAGFDARMRERQVGLDRMSSADRSSTEAAIKEETTDLEARLKAEKDAKVGWVTTNPYLKASLDDTLTFGKQELNRISALKSARPVDGGKAYRDALQLIQSGADKSAVTTAISAAKTALVPQKYLAELEAAAAAK